MRNRHNDSDLRHAYERFAEAYLAAMQQITHGVPPTAPQDFQRFMSEGTMSRQSVLTLDIPAFMHEAYDRCRQSQDVQGCAQAHWEELFEHLPHQLLARSVHSNFASASRQILHALAFPVHDAMMRQGSTNIATAAALAEYERYLARWRSDHVEWTVTALLVNFEVDVEQTLPGGIVIKPLRYSDKNSLLERWDSFPFGRRIDPPILIPIRGTMTWNMSMKVDGCTAQIDIHNQARQRFREETGRALTALRLMGPGMVGFDQALVWVTSPAWHPESSMTWIEHETRTWPSDRVYAFTASNAEALQDMARLIDKRKKSSSTGLALDRFNKAYGRQSPSDRLVDIVIALECILTDREDISYKFRMRGASLLARSDDPFSVNERLQALYKARSSIVHDGSTPRDVEALLVSGESLFRDLLRVVMQDLDNLLADSKGNTEKQKLIHGIDRMILNRQTGEAPVWGGTAAQRQSTLREQVGPTPCGI
jgi:hypothetical protein